MIDASLLTQAEVSNLLNNVIQNKMIDASLLTQAEVSNLLNNVSECILYEHFCNANIYR
jgi:hypothetical protein